MSLLCDLGMHKWQPYKDTLRYGGTGGYDNMTIIYKSYCERECGVKDKNVEVDYSPYLETYIRNFEGKTLNPKKPMQRSNKRV